MRLKILFASLKVWYSSKKHITPSYTPLDLNTYHVKRKYVFELDSPEHKLAQESLIFVAMDGDTVTYTDNGILENTVLFEDLCNANRKAINDFYSRQLKRRGLDY